ncbi:MAG TPA: phosphoglycerate mutase family protein [Burkholderiales bacterium]|nr:phosphoglycerate mutase family protein [Burkholderiales bacterium]
MELLLVRHALAFERNARRWPDDGERPLSPRGIARAQRAAAGLKRLTEPPGRVLTSPLQRTLQTAAILTRHAHWPRAEPCNALLPGSAAEELLALLARMSSARIAAVGHEPDLGEFLGTCLGAAGRGLFTFRKMGVAAVEFRGRPGPGRGRLLWFVAPRVLRAAR